MIQKGLYSSVLDAVVAHSGMTEQELLHDDKVYKIDGIKEACQIIQKWIKDKTLINIAGDYDADGICASAIMKLAIEKLGGQVKVRLPKRFSEGFGLSEKMIDEFGGKEGLITVDNGITSIGAVQKAKDKGMEVIVTDHHLPDVIHGVTILPKADVIIDPNAIEDSADFSGYCGAGLAWKIACELLGKEDPKLTTIAAIATVADCVPMLWENRRIVKNGLKLMTSGRNLTQGLWALLRAFELNDYIDTGDIGFKLAPALNAPGRLADDGAVTSFNLITFDGEIKEALKMAAEQVELNNKRRELSDIWSEKAKSLIFSKKMEHDFPIVLALPDAPEGIIGIISGKMAELFQAPCFALTEHEGVLKGSGRTFGGVHLKKLLDHNSNLLLTYGGHAAAAGVSLESSNLDALRVSLNDELSNYAVPSFEIQPDLFVTQSQIDSVMKEVSKYEPYGEGNPSPIVCVEDLTLIPNGSDYYKTLSKGGVKLQGIDIECIAFGDTARKFSSCGNPRHVCICGTLSKNFYMGNFKNQMNFIDLIPIEKEVKKSPLALALERQANKRY